jgi:hypothetical protein
VICEYVCRCSLFFSKYASIFSESCLPFRVWLHLVIYQETARGPNGRNTRQ